MLMFCPAATVSVCVLKLPVARTAFSPYNLMSLVVEISDASVSTVPAPRACKVMSCKPEKEISGRKAIEPFCVARRRDIAAELAGADLFVLPSYAEGNSNAVLEAMSAGLPIVATRVGGASIQIGREGERFLVPSGDPPALADRLLELIEDERLRLRLGAAMRARVERVFSIDRVAAVYEQAYELMRSGRCQQIGQLNSAVFACGDPEDIPCAG